MKSQNFTAVQVERIFCLLTLALLTQSWGDDYNFSCDILRHLLVFPELFDRQRDILFTGSLLFYVINFFFFCMLVFIALVDLRHRMDTLALSANISVYQSNTVLCSQGVNDPSRYFYFYSNSEGKILIKKSQFSISVCLYRTITQMRMFK